MQRLSVHQVGSLLNRSYAYDNAGNVATITDNHLSPAQTQTFTYDARDRLLHAWTTGNTANAYDESASYDVLGNFMTKGTTGSPTGYTYNASHPHAPVTGIGGSYVYDANGNMMAQEGGPGPARTITWNSDHQPSAITSSGTPDEYYSYDADGGRIKRVAGEVTTYTMEGLWEEDWLPGDTVQPSTTRSLYAFNGQVVAERTQFLPHAYRHPHGDWYRHADGHADQYAHQHAD